MIVFSSIFIFLFFLTSSTESQEQVGMTAYESIRKLKECIDLVDKPEFRRLCEGKVGIDKDECIEKFTKKMMPTLNACIEGSRRKSIPIPSRDEF